MNYCIATGLQKFVLRLTLVKVTVLLLKVTSEKHSSFGMNAEGVGRNIFFLCKNLYIKIVFSCGVSGHGDSRKLYVF